MNKNKNKTYPNFWIEKVFFRLPRVNILKKITTHPGNKIVINFAPRLNGFAQWGICHTGQQREFDCLPTKKTKESAKKNMIDKRDNTKKKKLNLPTPLAMSKPTDCIIVTNLFFSYRKSLARSGPHPISDLFKLRSLIRNIDNRSNWITNFDLKW